MPLIQRKGAQSSQGFGEFSAASGVNPNAYIENLFSTWLYTGTGANQTITNNINLSGDGGLVWIKDRTNAYNHNLFDTAQGATKFFNSNTTAATAIDTVSLTSFNANGFSLGTGNTAGSQVNTNTDNFASWTFKKQAKFFDIVTYTGTGANRTISHNLGSTPGCIIVKRTDSPNAAVVYHSGLPSAAYALQLNNASGASSLPTYWNSTAPTSSVFSVGTSVAVNASGGTYVAYLFASNAGGFGSDGTQNVITCGSFTTDGSGNATVNLGYEPQWLLSKSASATGGWYLNDTMRGMSQSGMLDLFPNGANAEVADTGFIPTATGFTYTFATSTTYIYIAIRRGPMKTPTVGTSVFSPIARTGTGTTTDISVGFAPDLHISKTRAVSTGASWWDRLRGTLLRLNSATTDAENSQPASLTAFNNITDTVGADTSSGAINSSGTTYANWVLGRAPGFFDEVCYTGTGGAGQILNHNLGVSPEMIIIKDRTSISNWSVSNFNTNVAMYLDSNGASFGVATATGISLPTTTTFKVAFSAVNNTGDNFVAYLFASCPGVSKIGTYSGTGATQTINCGFTGGARFVMIKRTDSTGDWYVWDTARGMVAGTDPYLLLDSTAAEVNANNVYTTSVGFQIVGTGAGINASGGTYLYLAVA